MPTKYYVQSGTLREVLIANNPKDACIKAIFKRFKSDTHPVKFAHIMVTSERSFVEFLTTEDILNAYVFKSHEILNEIGFLDLADILYESFPAELNEFFAKLSKVT